jgi:hypothetical protein
MDLVLIMLILALVVLFITAPLRRVPAPGEAGPELNADPAEPRVLELEAARDAKLRELRDAELDFRTGKLSDADYQALDGTLRAEAIEILRALDEAREQLAADAAGYDEGQGRSAADTITD